jgi:hypothetical protein
MNSRKIEHILQTIIDRNNMLQLLTMSIKIMSSLGEQKDGVAGIDLETINQ